jgi:uncharacterized membrane protein (DUF2068 family)
MEVGADPQEKEEGGGGANLSMRARPLPVTIAAVLLALLSLANLLSPLMLPDGVLALVVVLGVAGLWMLKRWSVWLTIIAAVCSTSS